MLARILPALFAFAAASPVDAESVEELLERMDRAASSFKGISAQVKRVAHTGVINEDNIDLGTVLVKRAKPNELRLLIDITAPDAKTVAYQGRKVEIFLPKINTVQEIDAGKHRGLVEQFFLLGFGTSRKELEADYSIKSAGNENVGGSKTTRIELVPKSKDLLQYIKKVELWISDSGFPLQQKFYQSGGDYQLATYSDLKINPDLPDSALRLKLPKNVKREYPQKQ
jgi:outer membrane lipoprotein-sorting protein